MTRLADVEPNLSAFLDMIAWSEIGPKLLEASDDGYNVLVGGTLFQSYADHPRQVIEVRPGLKSSAAGRYQLLARYYDPYRQQLGLVDFSPESQDAIAIQQIRECRATPAIENGALLSAISLCSHIWASLPGAGYGQRENAMSGLRTAYIEAGGKLT